MCDKAVLENSATIETLFLIETRCKNCVTTLLVLVLM